MKHYFICSLCHRGVLGGCLIVDEQVINFKTGKVTVDSKYRNLVLNRDDITHGGRRYPHYAYTEQGIAMLSAVLRSDVAINVSIRIMKTFVEMRKYIAHNALILEKSI